MKNYFLSICLFLFVANSFAQDEIIVFKSYDDFKAKKGQVYEFVQTNGAKKVTVKKDGVPILIRYKAIWGFQFKGVTFRTIRGYSAALVSSGEICYYENGWAHMSMLINGISEAGAPGYDCFLSVNLASEIAPLPSMPVSGAVKFYQKFRKNNPKYANLYECIGKITGYQIARKCVKAYNDEE